MIAGPAVLGEIAKAMDCVAICAPRIGQMAALYGLQNLAAWREDNRALMRDRVAALRATFRHNDIGYQLVSAGAYFAYLRHPFARAAARHVAKRLADSQNILCLPRSLFGPGH